MISLVIDHLIESTAFALLMGLLTLCFANNRAAVRHGLWLAASIKFLIPFSLIVAAGSSLRWETAPAVALDLPQLVTKAAPGLALSKALPLTGAALAPLAHTAMAPFAALPMPAANGATDRNPASLLAALWLMGCALLLCRWTVQWLRLQAVRNASTTAPIEAPIPVRFSATLFEPGLVGITRPVLLLPEGIAGKLSPVQLALVIEHELCHWRRRDNLTAALHMAVTLVFWFHPLLWWIGARLVTERERACDESVLANCSNPKAYADSILEVCRFYIRSPLACAPGVAGANLMHRVERIMTNAKFTYLSPAKFLLLTAVAAGTLLLPMAAGLLTPPAAAAPTPPSPRPAAATPAPTFGSGVVLPTAKPAPPNRIARKTTPAAVQVATLIQPVRIPASPPLQGAETIVTASIAEPASTPIAPPSAAPAEEIVVTGRKIRDFVRTRNFVRSYTAPSEFLDQISRWQAPLCVKTSGLAPAYNAFITSRLKEVATEIGAPKVKSEPCAPNLSVIFSDRPQELLDQISAKKPKLLGVHYPALRKKLATVTHPIQAWYATGTRDTRGRLQLDDYDGWWGFDFDWLSAPVFMVPGSRLDTGLTSEFASVVVVADKAKIADWQIGTIADYIAMTAFARANMLDKCQQVPSIANVLENCADGVKATALSDFDVAYLKALYSSRSNVSRTLQESEISSSMLKIMEKQVAAKGGVVK